MGMVVKPPVALPVSRWSRGVGGPGVAADDVDVGVVVAVDVAGCQRHCVCHGEDGLGLGEGPAGVLEAEGDRGLGEDDEVGAAVVVDVGQDGVHGVDRGAGDRGDIGEPVALVVPEQAQATGVPADQQVRPAITVVVDGARG